jgi:hypothetical protein
MLCAVDCEQMVGDAKLGAVVLVAAVACKRSMRFQPAEEERSTSMLL